ncbi:hypothetical protein SAMN06265795_109121 [Noviherbaspirillum humi]|uniref:Uncharacterized protein n=1 Tax=Noviherbaspirillum humi TaxID=1688639 RepID=A0A239IHT4_9BURK|nr:hypothetical protein [Noviherbaspirillum humi]SNS93210.1 hypothetical protein SAMN06265795_109121 [Noviherbaspirillum humi]
MHLMRLRLLLQMQLWLWLWLWLSLSLSLWLIRVLVVTFSLHYVGILSIPWRMAYFDYTDPAIAPKGLSVTINFPGGLLLVVSTLLFILILLRDHRTLRIDLPEFQFSRPLHPPTRVPIALNSVALWLSFMIVLNRGELRLSHRQADGHA